MKRLQVVLKQIMLRRRKDQLLNGEVLIKLPKRHVNIISCEFNASEKEFYYSLEMKMEDVIEKIMASKGGNTYIGVLTMLLRLRQGIWLINPVLKLYNDGHYPIQLAITQF
jgi:SNF2 family DNA or RNA helicase